MKTTKHIFFATTVFAIGSGCNLGRGPGPGSNDPDPRPTPEQVEFSALNDIWPGSRVIPVGGADVENIENVLGRILYLSSHDIACSSAQEEDLTLTWDLKNYASQACRNDVGPASDGYHAIQTTTEGVVTRKYLNHVENNFKLNAIIASAGFSIGSAYEIIFALQEGASFHNPDDCIDNDGIQSDTAPPQNACAAFLIADINKYLFKVNQLQQTEFGGELEIAGQGGGSFTRTKTEESLEEKKVLINTALIDVTCQAVYKGDCPDTMPGSSFMEDSDTFNQVLVLEHNQI